MGTYVYIILNPLEKYEDFVYGNEIRWKPLYVGKGTKNRYLQHFEYIKKQEKLTKKNNTYKNIQLKRIFELGLMPLYIIIETNSNEESIKLERELISYFGRKDMNSGILSNLTDGGDGISNISEETRKRMSESHRGKTPGNVELFKNWYRKLTKKELQLKCSRAGKSVKNRPKNISESHKEKISNTLKGKPKSDDHKSNISKAKIGSSLSKETRDKISNTKKAKKTKPHNYKEFDPHIIHNVVFLYNDKEFHVSDVSKILNISQNDIFTILNRCNIKRKYRRKKKNMKSE